MKPSMSIPGLKRQARLMARERGIPLHDALRQTAHSEGFNDWGLLVRQRQATSADAIVQRLEPGDLVLLAARPGKGKTLFSLRLALQAIKAGRRAYFFTLEYTEQDVLGRFKVLRHVGMPPSDGFVLDASDNIDSGYMMGRLKEAPRGALVFVDYLQLLDQSRSSPPLGVQVDQLQAFAAQSGISFVFISQIARSYDPALKAFPDLGDVRLPNAVDLGLFNKGLFLNGSEIRFECRL